MKAFFEGIQWLFEKVLYIPQDFLKDLELKSWFAANIFNWIFMGICTYYIVYWIKQLKLHKANNDEYQDTTAHSYLDK
ncbi:uracil phosphoribosyltransferase [Flavobacterium branchiophilum NBRC 15030 = ATCC 35035]|uniref:Uracil phosphoribosyltransferase n=2 Tax=Flavobacterium branchiophilum TaxID=55197 RepID=G2Z6D5_FLABF|nr:hypothetical protein [Flavobacterium branchiophilum]OXA80837.1 uracil phosphoribosyltransferase [Flavobacterium branchiophilum NBRC 15030 = ATCC 35035]PDS23397.1 uracil phosphoribosyltransferase [Flavobacterium branchiophilum]TQM40367.1 hypothetical protein BC670_1250 [Flavobacterium branchiophilum]CCB70955.1 Protein of unknown function [Flavobacterium branchiophilum FL-15]GEM54449.1 hypothetical protein FB1_06700 [Flavobacterium branchiophilum NBRC 15030 = ATCC 35035]